MYYDHHTTANCKSVYLHPGTFNSFGKTWIFLLLILLLLFFITNKVIDVIANFLGQVWNPGYQTVKKQTTTYKKHDSFCILL